MTDLAMKIAGKEFYDFFNVNIRYSMEAFARDFSFDFTDRFINDLTTAGDLPFIEGDTCQITVDGELVIDGFIDDIPISYDGTSHSLQVTGRSLQGDLVDCSAIHKTGHWKDAKLIDLCKDVAEPFGIAVKFDPATVLPFDAAQTEPFRKWAIEDEESAHDFIVRACKMRGVFPLADAGTGVTIAKASPVPSGAVLSRPRTGVPGNILRGNRVGRYRERFSEYIVKSQSAGFDDWYGEDAASKGVHISSDSDIERYRPLVITSDGGGAAKELELRANWERNVRAGRSRRLSYDVQGAQKLGDLGGSVWTFNETVFVDDDFFGVQGLLLIIGVNIRYSNDGTITTLEIGDPAQFDTLKPPTKRKKAKKGRSFL